MNNRLLACIAGLIAGASAATSAPQTFDFKDPKGVNNAVFKLDATLEAIQGSANGISGSVSFDPADPASTRGKILVAAGTLHVPNPTMKTHLHGAQWLDVAKNPVISFETKELKNVKTTGDTTTAEAVGTLSIKGLAKEMTVPVKLTYLKDKLGQRVPNMQGDLLVIRSSFVIKRSDFRINPTAPQANVSDEIEISLSIAGAAARQNAGGEPRL